MVKLLYHILGQKAPSFRHYIPQVLFQGRNPVSKGTKVKAGSAGLIREEVSQEEINDILNISEEFGKITIIVNIYTFMSDNSTFLMVIIFGVL